MLRLTFLRYFRKVTEEGLAGNVEGGKEFQTFKVLLVKNWEEILEENLKDERIYIDVSEEKRSLEKL